MTTNKIDKLISELKQLGLSAQERSSMRGNLIQFMAEHPVSARIPARQELSERSKPVFSFLPLISRRLTNMPALIIALIIALTGGTSVAAQSALPGQLLYPVKVHVNEEVQTAFAFSPQAKATLFAQFAQERLQEAEKLAADNSLNASATAQVQANFQDRINQLNAQISELKARGEANEAAGISSNFEAALQAHMVILNRLEARASSSSTIQTSATTTNETNENANAGAERKSELHDILNSVQAQIQSVTRDREDAEATVSAQADVKAAAQGKMDAAQNKLNEVGSFLTSSQAKVSASVFAEAQARLQEAQTVFAQGQAQFTAGAYGDAFEKFQESMRIAQQAKLIVTANMELHLDVNVNGNADDHSGRQQSSTSTDTELKADSQSQTDVQGQSGTSGQQHELELQGQTHTETQGGLQLHMGSGK